MANTAAIMRRVHLVAVAAAAIGGFAGWVSLGSLAVSGPDAASRVGFLPPWWMLAAFITGAMLAALKFELSTSTSLPLFFSLVVLLPWIPGSVPPAFLIWSGPIEFGVWTLVAAAMMLEKVGTTRGSHSARARGSLPAAAVAFVAYLAAAWSLADRMPTGDEPHYLIITQSILRDGDIRIENNHAETQYRDYWSGPLRPHFAPGAVEGDRYSIHAPGLSAIVAPAYAAAGYPGVVVFLALIASAGSGLLWRAAHSLTGSASAAWFAWAAGALSVPFFFESFAVYPDGVAATVLLFAVLPLIEPVPGVARWIAIGTALSILPWLHSRFAVLSGVMACVLLLKLVTTPEGRARIAPFLAVPIASAVIWFGFFRTVYGTFNPSSPYGGNTRTSASYVAHGLSALWFDQQFGVLPNAPVYACCLAGLALLARHRPRLAIELSCVVVAYLLAVSSFEMWWAGDSPPARFLAPVLPLMAIPGAWLWATASRRSTRAAAIGAVTASLLVTAALASVDGGRLVYNTLDGYARLAEWITPTIDLPLALPSFFRQSTGEAVARAMVWVVFLAAAVAGLRWLERSRYASGTLGLAAPLCIAGGIMGAATTVWALDSVAVFNPESTLSTLPTYSARLRPIGVDFGRSAFASAETLLPVLVVSTPVRRGPPSPGTLLLVPTPIPGGEYEVRLHHGPHGDGRARLVIGRMARPLKTWDLATDFRSPVTIRFPVTVGSLAVLGDDRAAGGGLTLVPRRIWEGSSFLTRDIARRVERYGPAQASFFAGYDGSVFLEDPGFWVRGGRSVQLAVAPEDGERPLAMFVRNAAVSNLVQLEMNGETHTLQLQPREELTLPVPIDTNRPGALITIQSTSGFRPSEVEPGSTDTRLLGVWIEFR
jgi:hypothetical protein